MTKEVISAGVASPRAKRRPPTFAGRSRARAHRGKLSTLEIGGIDIAAGLDKDIVDLSVPAVRKPRTDHPMAVSALGSFCQWLEQTPPSLFVQSHGWVVPAVQTVHILAISAVAGSALMMNLRLLGVAFKAQPVADVARRFAPVIWWALPILLLTGLVLTLGEPARELLNPVFRIKMLLVLAATALLAVLQARLNRNPKRYERGQGSRGSAIAIAIASLVLWTGIVIAGRWIAYV